MKYINYLILLISFVCSGQRNFLEDGNIFLSQKKDKEAEVVFREAIKSDEKNLIFHTQLGLSLSNQGKYEEAEKTLDYVLEYDKWNPAALWYSGINNFVNAKNFKKSISYFERVYPLIAKDSPQYFGVNFFIGKAYRNLLYTEGVSYKETSRMLETLKEYVRLQPNASDASQFQTFIKYVEEKRPPENVKKWVVTNEKNADKLIKKELEKK